MNKTQKAEAVESLNRVFQDSQGVILLDFKGISVPDITQLRDKIRETGSEYRVIKNTLAIRAAEDTPVAELREFFVGPTAVAYTSADSVGLAKVLRDFVKDSGGMTLKAAVLEGQAISIDQVEALADLPSREELISKLMFLAKAPVSQLAAALQSPLRNLALLLKQLGERKEQ
jgi:large subunit ribosomal protein L10